MKKFIRQFAPDGTRLTNVNCAYACSTSGSDSNIGTREAPVKTITRLISLGKAYNCIKDGIYALDNELIHIGTGRTLFPDQNYFTFAGNINYNGGNIYNCIIKGDALSNQAYIGTYKNSIIDGVLSLHQGYYGIGGGVINNLLVNKYKSTCFSSPDTHNIPYSLYMNFTIRKFFNYLTQGDRIGLNHIFTEVIDLYPFKNQDLGQYPIFQFCLFRKALKFLWNGNEIPVTYSADKSQWITDLKESLANYANNSLSGAHQEYLLTIVENSFQEGCIIHDDINDTSIFNKYDENHIPLDYTLFLHEENPALFASKTGTYVGAYAANVGVMEMSEIVNVDENGQDDTETSADLLIYNETDNSYESNRFSSQIWNRVRTNVLTTSLRGFRFEGLQCALESGLNSGFYFGKKQNFSFEEIPVETIEIIPYDDMTTPSAFPRFSAKLTSDTQMFFHKTGEKINQPVLFSDLQDLGIQTDIDLAIYGDWAVTDADYDYFNLIPLNNVYLKQINIPYLMLEINLHYGEY